MKIYQIIVFGMLCVNLVSCVKTESKKINVEVPKSEPIKIGTEMSGYRCDLISDSDQKEILILLTDEANGKKRVHFFDFISATRISSALPMIGDYTLLSFTLNPVSDDGKLRSDSGLLLNSQNELLIEEGKVISINGFLTLDKEMNGIIEQNIQFIKEDDSIHTTDLVEVARIENCKVDVVEKI